MSYELRAVPKPGVAEKVRPLRQKKRMKRYNAKRKGHAFPKNVDEARREHIRSKPCVLRHPSGVGGLHWLDERRRILWEHVCNSPTRACHLKSRGSGGKDAGNMWPGCDGAHDEQHRIGIPKFQKRWNVDLADECAKVEAEYVETRGVPHLGAQP